MMPLKILFLLSDVKGSATYVRAINLANQLATLGHDVSLIVVSKKAFFTHSSYLNNMVRVLETPRFMHNLLGYFTRRLFLDPGTGPLDILLRLRELGTGNYDLVQLFDHSLNVYLPWLILHNHLKTKCVADWCDVFNYEGGLRYAYSFRLDYLYKVLGLPFRKLSQYLEFSLRRGADGVTAISKGLKDFAIEQGVDEGRLMILEGGADVDSIVPIPKNEARQRLGLPIGSNIVGFLGSFQGDLDILIQSFSRVKRKLPDSYLLVIGTPSPWITSAVSRAGIATSYIEAGRCPDELLPQFLASVDVLTLPLRNNLASETRWPNRIGEYMASGRPIVVSDVGDTARVVKQHEIGLVAGTNIDSFADTIVTLLQNTDLAQKMGVKAREVACNHYSWALQAARLEQFYFQLLSSNITGQS